MFVRRLLVCAVLASLAACAAPTSTFVVDKNPNLKQRTSIGSVDALDYQLMPKRSSAAFSSTVSTQDANNTALCLQQHLSSEFKLPPEFVSHKVYTDNNHSVGLINPFTKVEGITMDVENKGSSSEIKLYDNGNLLSRAWKQLPSKCGQGKTTTLAKAETSTKTKASTSSQNAVDFTALNKPENSFATSSKPNIASVPTKATPLVKAEPIRVIKDSNPVVFAQATDTESKRASSVFNPDHDTPAKTETLAFETSTKPAVARFTESTPTATLADVALNENISATPDNNTWDRGDLTQDDMSIIAPATAAVITPAMAIAAKNTAASKDTPRSSTYANSPSSNRSSNGKAVNTSKPNTNTAKAVETSKSTTATRKKQEADKAASNKATNTKSSNKTNAKQVAKDKQSNTRTEVEDRKNSKTNSKNNRNNTDKTETGKNQRNNGKSAATETKNTSKNSRNKVENTNDAKASKGKNTNERNAKSDNKDSKTNSKKAVNKTSESTKNNKKATQEQDNNSKSKNNNSKTKTTDKKTDSAKKTPKKDKAK